MDFIDLKTQLERIRPEVDAAIARVLDHGKFIMGPEVAELEALLADAAKSKHCLGCSNGTDALVLALRSLEIGPGDAVIVPSFTFAATAESVVLVGATPIFVDVEKTSYNLDVKQFEAAVGMAEQKGLNPRAVIAVDLFGLPADYDVLVPMAEKLGITVIADAAQSFGAQDTSGPVGSRAPLSTTSFFPAKPLGCYGDGGAVFTDDDDLLDKLRSIRVHGKGSDKYENIRIGLNARLDTLQAAILLPKARILPDEIKVRNVVAKRYNELLNEVVHTPVVADGKISAWAQYTIEVDPVLRPSLIQHLKDQGIPTAVYYPIPLHRQKAYSHYPVVEGNLKVTDALSQSVMSLPMHPYLTEDSQVMIAGVVTEFISQQRQAS